MPEEVFILAILFVAFPWVLFRGIIAVRKTRGGTRSGGLKASDLREIVEEAVAASVEPLHDRIDTLEGLLMGETPDGARRIAAELLEADDDDPDLEDLDLAPRRRRRATHS